MAPSDDGPPLSLRPFPVADKKPKNLADFISRVNARPGGFRGVTEHALAEEISAAEQKHDDSDSDDVDMLSDAGAQDDEPATRDPNVARMEVLKNIDIAGNAAMLTLDSLSLLLSKQNPTQAGVTLSQQLREMVGIGTLGADKLDDANTTDAKAKDGEEIALGWTLMEINKTRDSAEEASRFLKREVEAEGRYWEDVMAVKKAGWALCKMPQERHTLGVRFGFSEAAAEFKNNGLAPLRRNDDGSVQLDCGRLGDLSERLVVTYERDGKVVGRSTPRAKTHDRGSLESRVLEARNTIFSQELWHELSREVRTLAAYDVRPEGSKLTFAIGPSARIVLELLALDLCSSAPDPDLPENATADTISLSLHILLSYAHRYNELTRIRPIPPHVSRSRGQQSYTLLRPVLARMAYMRSVEACTRYIGALTKSLVKAGITTSCTLQTQVPSLPELPPAARGPNQTSSTQTFLRGILQASDFTIKLAILDDASFTIRGRTFLYPVTATHYHIAFHPPASSLQGVCPPYPDGYPDIAALAGYLRSAIAHLLTEHAITRLSSQSGDATTTTTTTWIRGVHGTSIRDASREHLNVRFAVEEEDAKDLQRPVVVVSRSLRAGGEPETTSWRWSGQGHSHDRPLDDVVRAAVDMKLS